MYTLHTTHIVALLYIKRTEYLSQPFLFYMFLLKKRNYPRLVQTLGWIMTGIKVNRLHSPTTTTLLKKGTHKTVVMSCYVKI